MVGDLRSHVAPARKNQRAVADERAVRRGRELARIDRLPACIGASRHRGRTGPSRSFARPRRCRSLRDRSTLRRHDFVSRSRSIVAKLSGSRESLVVDRALGKLSQNRAAMRALPAGYRRLVQFALASMTLSHVCLSASSTAEKPRSHALRGNAMWRRSASRLFTPSMLLRLLHSAPETGRCVPRRNQCPVRPLRRSRCQARSSACSNAASSCCDQRPRPATQGQAGQGAAHRSEAAAVCVRFDVRSRADRSSPPAARPSPGHPDRSLPQTAPGLGCGPATDSPRAARPRSAASLVGGRSRVPSESSAGSITRPRRT